MLRTSGFLLHVIVLNTLPNPLSALPSAPFGCEFTSTQTVDCIDCTEELAKARQRIQDLYEYFYLDVSQRPIVQYYSCDVRPCHVCGSSCDSEACLAWHESIKNPVDSSILKTNERDDARYYHFQDEPDEPFLDRFPHEKRRATPTNGAAERTLIIPGLSYYIGTEWISSASQSSNLVASDVQTALSSPYHEAGSKLWSSNKNIVTSDACPSGDWNGDTCHDGSS